MEGKDLRIIEHPGHHHPLELRESLQGHGACYGGGCHQVYCDGCREAISSSSSRVGGGGAFYACPNSDCWFLLHKRCTELPPEIEHPSHPLHGLTLHPFPLRNHKCDVCGYSIDGFVYRCSSCDFDVHVRCASMAVHIQDRVNENNKIHQHPLTPIEMDALFRCAACGREHEGKSYLCTTCGFWANQVCASTPTTVDLHCHPHPLTLFRPFSCDDDQMCKICNEEVTRAYWGYRCSEECGYVIHVGCWLSEEAENSNKDLQTKLHSKSTSNEIEIPTDSKEDIVLITWPMPDEAVELVTLLIKNLRLQETHKRATNIILRCKKDHPLIFVNKKIDESTDDQRCDGCTQIISSQFYHCPQCNFSLHEWCAKLPNKLRHILHPEHPLDLHIEQNMHFLRFCDGCFMLTNGFAFGCSTCGFYLDLKCASLPGVIKHLAHDHDLALRMVTFQDFCNACGVYKFSAVFWCEDCNFRLCIYCALLPISVRHRYDDHPFALTYSRIKGQPNEYYCEICEEDINTMYWFYHCIQCDQSLHPKCIYPIERYWNVTFGVRFKMNFHSHVLSFVRRLKTDVLAPCRTCGNHLTELDYVAYDCEKCDFWMHHWCFKFLEDKSLIAATAPPN